MHLEDNKEWDPALFLNDRGSLLLFQPKAGGVRSIQEEFAAILLYHNQTPSNTRPCVDSVHVALFEGLRRSSIRADLPHYKAKSTYNSRCFGNEADVTIQDG